MSSLLCRCSGVVLLDGNWPPSEAKTMREKRRPALFPR
jgi:hypothetical protein